MESIIHEFIAGIERGPFQCLREYNGECASDYIVQYNRTILGQKQYSDIIDCAVYQAWLDMCRTVHGASDDKENKYKSIRIEAANKLRCYFNQNLDEISKCTFDGWLCSTLDVVGGKNVLRVGQVQKIINMAFKYLYCCEDFRSEHEQLFLYCHMPLDKYTLKWLYKKEQYKGYSWSTINCKDTYFKIQNDFRETLGDKNMLVAEFWIWQSEKKQEFKRGMERIKKNCSDKLKCSICSFVESINTYIHTCEEQIKTIRENNKGI